MSARPAPEPVLQGMRVLVVEDDYFIAIELCDALRRGGAEIVGPARDLESAIARIRSEPVDCAVLDIKLRGKMAFPIAAELRARGIPAIIATGYDQSMIPESLADLVRLEKPVDMAALFEAIESCRRSVQ